MKRPGFNSRRLVYLVIYILLVFAYIGAKLVGKGDIPSKAMQLRDKIEVKAVHIDLINSNTSEKRILWDNFANVKYENQFEFLSTENWENTQDWYTDIIIELAKKGNFNHNSLATALKTLKPSALERLMPIYTRSRARVPVGAFVVKRGNKLAWVLVIKWEYAAKSYRRGKLVHLALSHIEVESFDMQTGKKMCSIKCM